MLLHTCGAPVEVIENESLDFCLLQFFCKVCNTIVWDDHELFVEDGISSLERMAQGEV